MPCPATAAPAELPPPRQSDLFGSPAPAITRCKPGPIRVGTSGFSFADWVGPFYPPGTRSSAMLDFYRNQFNTVEINATYYRMPTRNMMTRMLTRTPEDFRFMVKLPGALTHQRDREISPPREFLEACSPLIEAGRFAGALAQFPYSFQRSAQNEAYLKWLRNAVPGPPIFAEFRHVSWDAPDLTTMLEAVSLGFCAVDEPALTGLFPRRALRAGPISYVRFHGRNAADWWSGGALRYHYDYTAEELRQWVDLIKGMADGAEKTYLFFNNCHAGHAVKNARMMEELLGLEREDQ